jgi:hypothetical protein
MADRGKAVIVVTITRLFKDKNLFSVENRERDVEGWKATFEVCGEGKRDEDADDDDEKPTPQPQ